MLVDLETFVLKNFFFFFYMYDINLNIWELFLLIYFFATKIKYYFALTPYFNSFCLQQP